MAGVNGDEQERIDGFIRNPSIIEPATFRSYTPSTAHTYTHIYYAPSWWLDPLQAPSQLVYYLHSNILTAAPIAAHLLISPCISAIHSHWVC